MREAESALDQAAERLFEVEENGPTPAFRDWLAADPAHAQAWAQINQTWQALGELPASLPQDDKVVVLARHRRPRLAWAGLAAAIIALGVFLPSQWLRQQADYLTPHGRMQQVVLPDGSEVTLAPNSALKLDFSDQERHVTLLRGEAFFDVTRQPQRPFVVQAEAVEARVLGTAFNIRLSDEGTEIALKEGSLAVKGAGESETAGPLVAGDLLRIGPDQQPKPRSRIAPEDIGSWQQGEIFVENRSVREVLGLISAWHPDWLTLMDKDLGARRVTGLYRLDQPEIALQALLDPVGGKQHRLGPWNIVITGSASGEK